MKRLSILLLALCSQVACATSTNAVKAQDIVSAVEQRGSRPVAQELYEDPKRWRELLTAISSGASEWLAVAAKLRPGTDAGASQMLETSVFFALGKSPVDSLKLISANSFSVEGVCSSNFLIDTPADQNALSVIDMRIRALRGISDPSLVATRDRCIKGLQQARLDALRLMGESSKKSGNN